MDENTYNYDPLNRMATLTGQLGFGYDALSRKRQRSLNLTSAPRPAPRAPALQGSKFRGNGGVAKSPPCV